VKLISPDYRVQGDTIIFSLTGLEKTARPGHVRGVLEISSSLFGSDKASLNTLQYLQHYLRETESHRAYFDAAENCRPSGLFVANTKPYQSVLPSTLAKWMMRAMSAAGIDTSHFKAHSSRSASASDLKRKGFSLAQILQKAHWSNPRTFSTFYDRA